MADVSAEREPSLEGMLASLRRIISIHRTASTDDEGEASEANNAHPVEGSSPAENALPGEAGSEREAVVLKAGEAGAEWHARTDPEPETERTFGYGEPMTPQSPNGATNSELPTPFAKCNYTHEAPLYQAEHGNEHLLSMRPDDAVRRPLGALPHTLLVPNARTIEDIIAEILAPILQGWLDDNLPELVERAVQEEIQRVSRGRLPGRRRASEG
jgi:cell pole-organizing protein PopZ